jgi:hypothetical protein
VKMVKKNVAKVVILHLHLENTISICGVNTNYN